jgi:hypothetical protein
MKILGRVAAGFLWLAGCMPATAGLIWIQTTDAGSLPGTAQVIYGQDEPLDAIFGTLTDANGANMFQILITDPASFTATIDSFDTDPANPSQVIPQIFLFDSNGFPVVGAFAAFVGHAALPFGPDPELFPNPATYFLMIDSLGVDPINVETGQPLFCVADNPFFDNLYLPCPGAEALPITGYQGFAVSVGIPLPDGSASTGTGDYVIQLTGVTAPSPEPASILFLATGLTAVLALRKRRR